MSKYYCYILESTTSRLTYVGFTVDVARRIRQHNGEITGGAKSTHRGRPWGFVCYISGFLTKRHARQCEWAIKHCTKVNKNITISSRSTNPYINKRVAKLFTVIMANTVAKTSPLNSDQNYELTWCVPRYTELDNLVPNVKCSRDVIIPPITGSESKTDSTTRKKIVKVSKRKAAPMSTAKIAKRTKRRVASTSAVKAKVIKRKITKKPRTARIPKRQVAPTEARVRSPTTPKI